MYTKIINPAIHGKTSYNNSGSCSALANYLNKENLDLPLRAQELFFNQERNNVTTYEVINAIDSNHKGLREVTPKFHSLVIAPTPEELKHINDNAELFKDYVRDIMQNYAQNFNLPNGKKLTADDLVWFGKLEYLRHGIKNENSMHVHIIVSARDKSQSITLNPNINNRERFNRVRFFLKAEKAFDIRFNYQREQSRLFVHQARKHGVLADRINLYQESKGQGKDMLTFISDLTSAIDYSPEEGNVRKKRKVLK